MPFSKDILKSQEFSTKEGAEAELNAWWGEVRELPKGENEVLSVKIEPGGETFYLNLEIYSLYSQANLSLISPSED